MADENENGDGNNRPKKRKRGRYCAYRGDPNLPCATPRSTVLSRLQRETCEGAVLPLNESVNDALDQPLRLSPTQDQRDCESPSAHDVVESLSEDHQPEINTLRSPYQENLNEQASASNILRERASGQYYEPEENVQAPANQAVRNEVTRREEVITRPCFGVCTCSGCPIATQLDFSNEPHADSSNDVSESRSRRKKNLIERYQLNEALSEKLNITKYEVLIMVLHIVMKFNLSGDFIEDILKFVNTLVGAEALRTSKYLFNKLFAAKSQIYFHFYCKTCGLYLNEKSKFNGAKVVKCLNPECNTENSVGNLFDDNFFVTMSVRKQVEDLFQRPDFKVLPRRDRNPDGIADVMDGELYQKLCQPGNCLSDPNSISLTFNTDGAQVFNSNHVSLWPIQCFINELPLEDRFREENVLLVGLWCGRGTPDMNLYLRPYAEELKELSVNGVKCVLADGTIISRPIVGSICSLDSVAKPKVLKMKQFNGAYACGYCMHPNNLVKDLKQLRFLADKTYACRTHQEVLRDMILAHEKDMHGELTGKNDHVHGVKGLSVLATIPGFDLVWSPVIDYLHCLLEGVMPKLVDLWCNSKESDPYHISSDDQAEIDAALLKLRPPQQVMCRPTTKLSLRSEWSAKDWRAFKLFYCLPCLKGKLDSRYYNHLKDFVKGSFIFLKSFISWSELEEADRCFQRFVKQFNVLYGDRNMVYNVHLLTHIPKMVKQFGPLWAYSNFVFESGNGHLLKLSSGTRGVCNQIAEKYLRVQFVSKYFEEAPVSDLVTAFCSDVMSYDYVRKAEVHNDAVSFGSGTFTVIDSNEARALSLFANMSVGDKVLYYNRVVRNKALYYSKAYSKPTNFDDTCVRLSDNSYAVIEKIVKLPNMGSLVAIISPIRISEGEVLAPHIKTCAYHLFAPAKAIQLSDIAVKCVMLNVPGERNYICEIPNFYERD